MQICDAEFCICSGLGPEDGIENECQCTDDDSGTCPRCGAYLEAVDDAEGADGGDTE